MNNKCLKNILWFKEIDKKDLSLVGGKNASLGEMFSELNKKGVNIPDGFSITTKVYWEFLKENKIENELKELFDNFDPNSIKNLRETGKRARDLFMKGDFPEKTKEEIVNAYQELSKKYNQKNTDVAVRSSAVCEDAPTDSFAGQFETFLNVSGREELLKSVKKCLASSFNDRVIAYREEKKISHLEFALSVVVQKMVRSDLASSGVIFTIDTESGFSDTVVINSVWGLGEMIVKGLITPDNFYVFKPTLKQGYEPIIIKNLGRKTKKYKYGIKAD